MTKKFEVGDKVRVNEDGARRFRTRMSLTDFRVGVTGVITEELFHGEYRVLFEGVSKPGFGTRNGWAVTPDEIELVVEEKRKFAVGDKVRDIRYYVGATGVIVGNGSFFTCDWRVKYDSDGGHGLYRPEHLEHLELIAPVAPVAPSPKFSVGDRVKVAGRVGEIDSIIIHRGGVDYVVCPGVNGCARFPESQLTLHTPRTWSEPDASKSVGLDVIDPLVDEMTTALRAHGGDCETRRFGDVMVVVENGQAKIYRLEASSDV